jgi:hypothetical protein
LPTEIDGVEETVHSRGPSGRSNAGCCAFSHRQATGTPAR